MAWEPLGTHEEHLSVLEYKKQESSKEVKELDSAIAQKRTEVEKMNSLKEKVNDRLAGQTSHHRKALMMEKENASLKREKASMISFLRKHGIVIKENKFFDRKEK